MKTKNSRWLALAAFVLVAVTFVAWKNATPDQHVNYYAPGHEKSVDTVPVRKKSYSYKKEYKRNDLDEAMQELDRAMVDLDKNLKIDLGTVNREIKNALEEIKKIDFDQIHAEVSASLRDVDWKGTHNEIKRALRDAARELKEVDEEKIHAEIDEAKENFPIAGDLIRSSVTLGLKAAKLGINKAKKEIRLLKDFTDELERDKLISRKEGFRIRIKDNEMYIDGKKQSKEVNDRYRKYFKEGDYTIKVDAGDEFFD